jgi:hypothetical protein
MSTENQIDHIAIVIDASSSMFRLRADVIRVVDNQIAYLARRSKDLNREVRVSIYTFADSVRCEIFDKDVLRLPSIKDFYDPNGMTALIAAAVKSQEDLKTTSTIYGDHAFLTFVITDGHENASRYLSADSLRRMLAGLPENYSVATLVPDHQAADLARSYGFSPDSVRPWDATSAAGVEAAGSAIQQATDNFMAGRERGVRGTRSVFGTGSDVVNAATVQATLKPLPVSKYKIIPVVPRPGTVAVPKVTSKGTTMVFPPIRVDDYVRKDCGLDFQLGTVYYEWSKAEMIQPQKRLAIVAKNGEVFVGTGDEIRQMIGLPVLNKKFAPSVNKDYSIFVQSTAPNRHLVAHSRILVMQ